MNSNSAQRLQYLITRTPADDRVGRSAPAVDLPIAGPAFEMPDGPSAGAVPPSVAHVAARRWSAPLERLRHHVTGAIDRGEQAPIVEQAPAVPAARPAVDPGQSEPVFPANEPEDCARIQRHTQYPRSRGRCPAGRINQVHRQIEER